MSKEAEPSKEIEVKSPPKRKHSVLKKIVVGIIIILALFFVIGLLAEIMYDGTSQSSTISSLTKTTTMPTKTTSKIGVVVENFKLQQDKNNTYYVMNVYDGEAKIATATISEPSKFLNKYRIGLEIKITPTTSTKVLEYGLIFWNKDIQPNIGIIQMAGSSALNYIELERLQTDDGKGVIYANTEWWLVQSGKDNFLFLLNEPFPKDIDFAIYFIVEKNGKTADDVNSHVTLILPSS